MNILYISPSINVKGGISTVIKGYLNSFLTEKYSIYLVASHVDGYKLIKFFKAISGLIETFYFLVFKNIDIVHIHGGDIISFQRKFYYIQVAKLFKCKVIYHHHGANFMNQYKNLTNIWKTRVKKTFESVELIICLSNNWRNNIKLLAPFSNTVIIPNSIEIPNPFIKKNNKHTNLTFLGLIGDRKGIFDLLSVVKRIIDDGYHINLTIGGNGEIDRLIKQISILGLANFVKYVGWICDKNKDLILRQTDIFVLPSYAEGMPMSIIEAMSYSVPIVSTFVGGIPELVINGKTGYLVKPGSLDDLYKKILLLINNNDIREKFGRRGRQLIINRHNIDIITKKIAKIYTSVSNS